MSLVLFDFDGTVTTLDTTLLLGVFVARKRAARHRLFLLVAALLLARFRLVSNTRLKRVVTRLLIRGQTMDQLQRLAREFHDAWINTIADDEILDALRAHVLNGDSVYLVSANFDWLLEPLVDRWSLAGVIATQSEHRAGIYTGGIIGTACFGHEKLRRVVAHFGAAGLGKAIAYGNEDDSPLLNAVRTGYLIRHAKPTFPLGLLQRYSHILSGKLSRTELTAAPKIELLPMSRSPEESTNT